MGPNKSRVARIRQFDGSIEESWLTGYHWLSQAMDTDPTTGISYALCISAPVGNLTLYRVDPVAKQVLPIASISGPNAGISPLVISPAGQAYAFDALGPGVYSMDLNNGIQTYLGALSLPAVTGVFVDAAFDQSGMLWASYLDTWSNQHTGLYKVDLSTLTHTKVISLAQPYKGLAWCPFTPTIKYCIGKVSSHGCVPSISAEGYACVAASKGFVISATDVPNNKQGLLFYGTSGAQSLPFQGGMLCIKSPIHRSPAVLSGGSPPPANDCTGALAIDFNAHLLGPKHFASHPPLPPPIAPGTTCYAQWWGRDPGFSPPFNSSLSDAVQFVVGP